jgi:hypothetical protein
VPSSRLHPTAATLLAKASRLPRFVPSSDFLNPSTVSSALGLAGLFHPAATSRVSLVQGLLSPCSHPPSSRGACPLAVGSPTSHPLARAAVAGAPRLRGFLPHGAAFLSRALFTRASVAPLLEFLSLRPSLPALSSSLPGALRSRRYLDGPSLSRSPFEADLSVSTARSPADTSPLRLPARVFEPSFRISGARNLCLETVTHPETLSRSLERSPPGCPRDQRPPDRNPITSWLPKR